MMDEDTISERWVVQFTPHGDDEPSCHYFDDPEALAKFIRVNARDAWSFKIAGTNEDRVARAALKDQYGEYL